MTKIEHANITAPDIDEAIRFIQIVAPDFKIRKDAPPIVTDGCTLGNDEYYFALQAAHLDSEPNGTYLRTSLSLRGRLHGRRW